MDPVDQTKVKQLLLDYTRRLIGTDNILFAMHHAQKQGNKSADNTPSKFRSTVDSYLGFKNELMDTKSYGS